MLAFVVSGTLTGVFGNPKEIVDAETPYGNPSAPLEIHEVAGTRIAVFYRHGKKVRISAHRVNYRANVWALKQAGATSVIAYATTGSVDPALQAGTFVVPDQIIDYTHDRVRSFETQGIREHFDFSFPFTPKLRQEVQKAASLAGLKPIDGGTYACTQGPRYETAAEIAKYKFDGCSIVGMTLMPEAALVRQLNLAYAALALVMNPGAGIGGHAVDIPGSTQFTDNAIEPIRRFNRCLVEGIQ